MTTHRPGIDIWIFPRVLLVAAYEGETMETSLESSTENRLRMGFQISELPIGGGLLIRTENSVYTLVRRGEDEFFLSGHAKYCPKPTRVLKIQASYGFYPENLGFIGVWFPLNFILEGRENRPITSTRIQEITPLEGEETQ